MHLFSLSFILFFKLAELDTNKLKPISTDLSQLNCVVENDAVKKKDYNAKIKNIEDKIPSITKLATNAALEAKMNKVKNKMTSITNVATNFALSNAK